jgi:hypothetical protein
MAKIARLTDGLQSIVSRKFEFGKPDGPRSALSADFFK